MELGTALGVKNQNDVATRQRKKFDDIFSRLDTTHQRVRRTDTGRPQRPRLRIASRGKNVKMRFDKTRQDIKTLKTVSHLRWRLRVSVECRSASVRTYLLEAESVDAVVAGEFHGRRLDGVSRPVESVAGLSTTWRRPTESRRHATTHRLNAQATCRVTC